MRSELDADIAEFGIELHRMNAAFPADPGLLGPAEGRAQIAQEPRIDPCDADVDLRRDAMGAGQVFGPDRRRQPVRTVIGGSDRFLLAVEWRDVATRPEYLLVDHSRVGLQAGPDRRLYERALAECAVYHGTPTTEN